MKRVVAFLCWAILGAFLGLSLPANSGWADASHPTADDIAQSLPPHALFVSPQGQDTATGTRHSPFRTLSHAIKRAAPGDTIVVRSGTYRETLPVVSKRLNLQAFPDEPVWIKGSVVVSAWERHESFWVHSGWEPPFCQGCVPPGIAPPDTQIATWPDQVFLDGTPLVQVRTRDDLTPQAFFVDTDRHQLVIATDPTGHLVEASRFETALVFVAGAEGSRVQGLGFAQFSPPAKDGYSGMVKGDASGLVFRDNRFVDSAAVGLNIYAPDAQVEGNLFHRNGLAGLGAWRADDLIVSHNVFSANNSAGFATYGTRAAAAGAKLTRSSGIDVRHNRFEGNAAAGLWLDISVIGATVADNLVQKNQGDGVFVELSADVTVQSNHVAQNSGAGLLISGSRDVRVTGNVVSGNGTAISVIDDTRRNPDPEETMRGATWVTGGIVVEDNTIERTARLQRAFHIRDYSAEKTAAEMMQSVDRNRYSRPVSQPEVFAEWWDQTRVRVFPDLGTWRAETGFDGNSRATLGPKGLQVP